MLTMTSSTSTSWFGARTVVASLALLGLSLVLAAEGQAVDSSGCRVECYPNTKLIHGKGGAKGENCRWILRTDGKAARLCDHIKCKKICPNNQAADQQEAASATENLRIEQQLEGDSPSPVAAAAPQGQQAESMGIMRRMHGNKLAQAPVPGVAGGRLSSQHAQGAASGSTGTGSAATSGRRMAPTLPPSVQYDDNDTPPPISRFLDISPEE